MNRLVRSAFTLFEVMISMLVLVTTILAMVMVLPIALRSQQHSRTSLYVSTYGLSLVESLHNPYPSLRDGPNVKFSSTDRMSQTLRNFGIYSAPYQYDIERYLSRPYSGALPLPVDIANRLDSDDGEIREILDGRGRLYYPDPTFVRALQLGASRDGNTVRSDLPAEMHKVVFGVVGFAQQNVLAQHPQDGWPIYETYPFPPNWVRYGAAQKRIGPVAIAPPHNMGPTMGSDNALQMFGDGGFESLAPWPSNSSPSMAVALDEGHGDNRNAGYHGRHWYHFSTSLPAPNRWSDGWTAFTNLAGNVKAGWLPVLGVISPSPSYVSAVATPLNTMWPGRTPLLPTYEMRASYRDRAIDLWNAVKPTSLPTMTKASGVVVDDSRLDNNRYEYPPESLRTFVATDPYSLTGAPADFPPHPAQVMALSYLAHSAMMVAGYCPPWSATVWSSTRAMSSTSSFSVFYKDENGNFKDAKFLAAGASRGATTVQLKDENSTEIRLYALDYLWFEEDETHIYRVAEDVTIPADGTGSVRLDKRYLVRGNGEIVNEDGGTATGALHVDLTLGKRVMRVASDADRAFARKVHEMCLRWAIAYASENPYDWGAPRPNNRQVATDKPLALFDLFWDAGPFSSTTRVSGNAVRGLVRQHTTEESRYRWIIGRNPWADPTGAFPIRRTPTGGTTANELSHLGPFDATMRPNAWLDLRTHLVTGRYAPPAASAPDASRWRNADEQRFWINRPFEPLHRTRKLVFWSVDWKSFADAETAITAPLDLAGYGKGVEQRGGDWWMYGTTDLGGDWPIAGNPEYLYIWLDRNRRQRWIDVNRGDGAWVGGVDDRDHLMGHWGADRNNNGRLDIGPVPRSSRMRAVKVCEFVLYDPILRVHAGN